jgi:hypothetical protein
MNSGRGFTRALDAELLSEDPSLNHAVDPPCMVRQKGGISRLFLGFAAILAHNAATSIRGCTDLWFLLIYTQGRKPG